MSEELLQTSHILIGRYTYHRLGASTLSQLKRARIVSGPIPNHIKNKRPDGLITLGRSTVKACIEYKTPAELSTEPQIKKAIYQGIEVARHFCNLLIVTDGRKTFWVNPHTGNRVESDSLPIFNAKALIDKTISVEQLQCLEQVIDQSDHSLSSTNDELSSPTLIDPSQLAHTIWQKIWINTGKEPEKCLYNVVELFVFKFLSDLSVLEAHDNFAHVYELSKSSGSVAALTNYAQISRLAIRNLFPEGTDGTTIINGTIFVNERGDPNLSQAGLFCEVLGDLQDFDREYGSFKYIQRQFKMRLYESFLRQGAGLRHLGQYFTPRNVVQAIVKMSTANSLSPGASLCDPFCGVGGFLLEAIIESPRLMAQFRPHNGVINPQVSVVGYDKGSDEQEDERTIVLAKANAIIYFSDLIAAYNSPDFIGEFARKVVNPMFELLRDNLGTFAVDDDAKHDLILTNPPYVTSGSSSLKNALEDAGIADEYAVAGRGTEALALQWIIKSLKPGGSAFVIVPDGLLNQENILNYTKQKCLIRAVVSLPIRTFYSTPKKTYILVLEHKYDERDEQTTPVFTYLVSEIGESRDANRWELDKNDLIEMVDLFNQFKGSPDAFTTSCLRCKIILWNDFATYRHWMVDRYWGEDELEQLGATQTQEELDIEQFNRLLAQSGETPIDYLDVNAQFKEVLLGDRDLFTLQIGRRVVRKNCVEQGIPCISANVRDVFGYIENSDLLTEFDIPSLTWGLDGNFDWHLIPAGFPFHPTDHCGVLRIVDNNIDPEYLYYALHATRDRHGFDRIYRANLDNITRVSVDIPICEDGTFDLAAQKKIAAKHREIEKKRAHAIQLLQQIADARIADVVRQDEREQAD